MYGQDSVHQEFQLDDLGSEGYLLGQIVEIGPIDSILEWFCMSGSQIRYQIPGFEMSSDGCRSQVKVSGCKDLFVISM